MANRDNPMGLRALKPPYGTHAPVRQYDAGTSVIYEGQLCLLNTTGLVVGVGANLGTVAADRRVIGVAAAYKALAATAGAKKVQVYFDPNQRFVIQSDDASLDSRTDYIGRNFAILTPNAGNVTTLQSKAELDGSSGTSASFVATTARALQVVDLFKQVGNSVSTSGTASTNADFVVRIIPKYHFLGHSVGA